ncbi:MAG: hypothetical protein ACI9VR_004210 [Cognaticolwellia sp.]|jgi:hypothetical protein
MRGLRSHVSAAFRGSSGLTEGVSRALFLFFVVVGLALTVVLFAVVHVALQTFGAVCIGGALLAFSRAFGTGTEGKEESKNRQSGDLHRVSKV